MPTAFDELRAHQRERIHRLFVKEIEHHAGSGRLTAFRRIDKIIPDLTLLHQSVQSSNVLISLILDIDVLLTDQGLVPILFHPQEEHDRSVDID